MLTVMIQASNGGQMVREALEVEAHDENNEHGYINMVLIRNPDGSETKFYDSAFFVMNDKGATVAKYDLRCASTGDTGLNRKRTVLAGARKICSTRDCEAHG